MGFSGGIKSGGGLFYGDGTLRPFTFSAIAPGADSAGDWAYVVLAFQPDGSDKVNTKHLFLGGVDRYEFEEGGTTAQGLNKDGEASNLTSIGAKTPVGRFFQTLVENGGDVNIESVLPDLEAGEPLNFDGLDGARVRLGEETDVKGTATKGQILGKDGISRDRKNVIVEAVYALAGVKAAVKSVKGAKANVNTTRDAADAIVLGAIANAQKADKKNKTGEIPASKLKMAALNGGLDRGIRDAVIALVKSEEYLTDAAEREVFTYDADGETVAAA